MHKTGREPEIRKNTLFWSWYESKTVSKKFILRDNSRKISIGRKLYTSERFSLSTQPLRAFPSSKSIKGHRTRNSRTNSHGHQLRVKRWFLVSNCRLELIAYLRTALSREMCDGLEAATEDTFANKGAPELRLEFELGFEWKDVEALQNVHW